jgi:hypothetical protein
MRRSLVFLSENVVDDPVLRAPHEAQSIAPPTALDIAPAAPMAPGVGGFNINLSAPRVSPVEGDVAIEDTRGRRLLPELVPELPIQTGRKTLIVWVERSSFAFSLLAIIGIVGVKLLAFSHEAHEQVSDITGAVAREGLSSAGTEAYWARLVVKDQRGFANEPLPIGISLKDAAGGETMTVAGLAEGTELSIGTSLGLAGWLVLARDLDNTFIGASKDFIGVMDATVTLHSASDQFLDSQVIRFRWIEKKDEGLMPSLNPPEPAPVVPLDPEKIATLIKVGEDFLQHGDVAAARTVLERAATAGNAHAALELGMTFDQAFLAQWGVLGFAPDLAQARKWYDRAIKLGSIEASRHLERLASTPR